MMLDKDGLICEYDGRVIDPKEVKASSKTREETDAEAKKRCEQIYERHKAQQK